MALKALSSLSSNEYETFLNSFDTVLSDCDGVLWLESEVIKGSPEVINKFKTSGKKIFYVTNNSTKTRDQFLDKFKKLGFNATKEEIIGTAYLTAQYLSSLNFNKKVYLIGSPGIAKELDSVGIRHIGVGPEPMPTSLPELVDNLNLDPEVGAVVVGFDIHFSVPKVVKATSYLERKGSIFIATNTDERYPLDVEGIIMPGTGAYVAAVQTAAERKPIIMGKPEAYIREYLVNKHKINPSRTLMIGDRCNSDILLGKRCGFQTLLVLTGVTDIEQAKAWKESADKDENALVPDYYTNRLGDLLPHL
uniref:4-nitrophenylphosphatase n=2 Tax=Homalodisca liturata TaxID=320908 RepID=A0A1B6IA33_9HEMI